MRAEGVDAIVIGTGQSGPPLARALAGAGWRTAIIERDAVGGTCINRGCTPTKTMVASARVAYLARRAADYGVRTGPVTVDQAVVRARKRAIVDSWSGSGRRRLEQQPNAELVWGEARFTGPNTVAVRLRAGGERVFEAPKIFINTGGRPVVPRLDGLDTVPFLDSTTVMELGVVPDHLIVVGGGYIGLEFGQMFRRFGARVTIIQRSGHLLSREDDDVADAVADILRQDGIEVLLETKPDTVARAGAGVGVRVTTAGGPRTIEGSHLLVATGRVPNVEVLDLAAAGVRQDQRGFIPVNERLETNVPGVYALGDVNGGPAFTHVSYDDFRVLKANLLDGGGGTTAGRLVPYTMFIDPQLGRVGLTETAAREQGLRIRVAKMPMSHVARALETDEPRGLVKAVVAADAGTILGAAALGIEGGEICSMLHIAMMGRLPYTRLRDGIFPHPGLAEALNNLFSSFTD